MSNNKKKFNAMMADPRTTFFTNTWGQIHVKWKDHWGEHGPVGSYSTMDADGKWHCTVESDARKLLGMDACSEEEWYHVYVEW